MNKKSIIITILAIVTLLLLTMYIKTNAESYSVGEPAELGMARPDVILKDKYGNEVANSKNLMNSSNFDYFCAKRGVKFYNKSEYGKAITFYNVAKVEIIGDTAKVTAGKQYGSINENLYTETYKETETNANKALALLFYKIKSGKAEIDEMNYDIKYTIIEKDGKNHYKAYSVTATKTGNRVILTRTRDNQNGDYGFTYDFGQSAMWRTMQYWQKNVAIKMDTQNQSLWSKVAAFIQNDDLKNSATYPSRANTEKATIAYENGKQLYSEVIDEVSQINPDNKYGIEETYYKDSSADKKVETRIDENSTTILGPFQYNFVGKIENGKPTLTFNEDTTSQEYTIGTYEGSEFVETNKIVSGNKFYIKLPTISLAGVTNIHLNFQIEGISLYNTKTTVSFFERYVNFASYQPIIHIEQEEGYNEPFRDSYKISKSVDITLEKKDESGNTLKAEGIKFQIKDETNTVIAYITTDGSGNGIVTNSKGEPTGETKVKLLTDQLYTLIENENNIYGYKQCYLSVDNIDIPGAKIEQSGANIKFALNSDCEDEITIKAKNKKELANLEIVKLGENESKLENVTLVIQIGSNEYLQLKDSEGREVTTVKGEITINSENIANSSEYHVEYITDKNRATKFITDSNGKIVIKNLEVNKSATKKYSYTACEISNPNYGYGSAANASLKGNVTELVLNQTSQIKMTNKIDLGNLKLEKYDEDKEITKLENVGFVIEISPSAEKTYAYIALYDINGKVVPKVKGEVTINRNNITNAEGKEYKVGYYCTDKSISELSETEKANITTFVTESNGTLTVNNLEVYEPKAGSKYKYKLVETSNANYGFIAEAVELGGITLESNTTVNKALGNKQKYTKISGYVWIENSAGKENEYDGIYTEGNKESDIKLTDLYVIKDGQLIKNSEAVTKVEIKLRDKVTGEFIKALPDKFDENGKYTFADVEIAKLADYEVVFVYNGFYYTTVKEQLDQNNGSKVKEDITERIDLNNKFETVKDNNEVVATDGTVNTVEYYKDGHTSTVSKLNFDVTVSANTTAAQYNLREVFDELKISSTGLTEELENVNMGIVIREQPKISINSDIYSVLIDFEGYKYNYKYNGRQNYYENKNGDDIGVKFEQENTEQRYTRTVYSSDVQAAKDQGKEIKVAVTYKIQLANESSTLNVMPKQIINYFDSRYNIKAVGLGLDQTTHTITSPLSFSQAQNIEGHFEYKSTVIDFSQLIDKTNNVKDLYITFEVQRDAILDLLNNKSTYHNATEILSYASYYGEGTTEFITDETKAGEIYAGIDKMSQPGNMEIVLVDHSSGDGTKVLDTTNFEDDTTSAPSLLLEAQESRKVSGTIFEDKATTDSLESNEKVGNGKYDEGQEKTIAGVIVELHKLNENGSIGEIAKYSNGEPVSTITNEDGNYTFGYYDEANKKHVGILPGRYVTKYIYNNSSYIVGGKNIDANEYKSTIIVSDVVKNAFNGGNEKWYLEEETNRYSDARDNIILRPEYNPDIDANITVTNSTYNNILVIDKMEAHTPIMNIGIEFTPTDEAEALTLNIKKEIVNVDLGIIERPDVDIKVEKQITGLEIIAQNGTNIIPKGDPSNPEEKMQYVKTGLDGIVSVEIESKLLQGAKLNLEYTITLLNNSQKDYLGEEYYYYGRIPEGAIENTSRVRQLVDYLDATMTLDTTQSEGQWVEKTADELFNSETKEGLVTEEVYGELKNGSYTILTTQEFEEVGAGNQKSVKLYASRYLAVSESIREENKIEIIEITGKRTIKESIPGNYVPTETPKEQNEDKVDLVITPPTGTTVNYTLYIVATAVTFTILLLGIVIIKKKFIK